MRTVYFIIVLFLFIFSSLVYTQEKKNETTKEEEFEESIEDNSYFIEEAYNQEERVVQHIFNCYSYSKPERDVFFTFTQEWPAFGVSHQLSYTIPYSILNSNESNGIGDIFLNYRYQLFYKEDWACCSPRFSIILPTGNVDKGFGNGVVGLQFCIPISKRFSDKFVTHYNLGLTILPNVKGTGLKGDEIKRSLSNYFVGASVIWLTHRYFNIMLEYLTNFSSGIDPNGEISRSSETIFSPGIRYAIELGNLEVMLGMAVPFSLTNDLKKTGLFLYLSFEHPY